MHLFPRTIIRNCFWRLQLNTESLYVSKVFTIHHDIIDFISKSDSGEFKIPYIRDVLLETTMQEKSKDYVRMFVSKQLNAMVKRGLLTAQGSFRNKVFHKTQRFEEFKNTVNYEQKRNAADTTITTKPNFYLNELNKIRSQLNGELAISIAEMDEYRSIMRQFPQTQEKVRKLYEESAQCSATITGQITALTKTIELLQTEES